MLAEYRAHLLAGKSCAEGLGMQCLGSSDTGVLAAVGTPGWRRSRVFMGSHLGSLHLRISTRAATSAMLASGSML